CDAPHPLLYPFPTRRSSDLGIRADRVHPRYHRAALSAVCGYDRDFSPSLRVQCTHAESGVGCAPAAPSAIESGTVAEELRLVQPHVPARHRWLCSLERSASPEDRCCCGAPSGVWHCCWIFWAARADERSTG